MKKLLYDEQQQMIEEELTPAGIFNNEEQPEVYVEGGDVWTVVGDTKVY